MRYDISFHFDGTIIEDHKITARTLDKTLTQLQRAIDKAYIETLYGKVEKNSRLSGKDYANADFITGTPRDGGYILDLFSKSDIGKKTCNKIIKGIMMPILMLSSKNPIKRVDQSYMRKFWT